MRKQSAGPGKVSDQVWMLLHYLECSGPSSPSSIHRTPALFRCLLSQLSRVCVLLRRTESGWEPPRVVSSGPICSPLGATSGRHCWGWGRHTSPQARVTQERSSEGLPGLSLLATRRPSPLCPVSSRAPAVASAPRTKVILYGLLLKAVTCDCPRPRAG